ncbi:MAG: 16S rRNA (adenine(1518)-N(6)/adenine(1519)-N(6))-dimethyltransferase RsmA [Planctomycetia bacterium]|nr:16S rRNA (adenine(1518)-N(6)/adenine(1519)-N(6))-dimethyltransferase RsmA [Planctomycetia bacterium]
MAGQQTISYLTRRFREVGFEPVSRHGQNFLIDMNLQRLLVDAAQLDYDDVVLEVGTGTGALTALVAPQVAAVVTVEIDERLFQMASDELVDNANVTLLKFDVLKNKNHFDPRLMEVLGERLAAGSGRQLKLVANLPYSVATPIISNLLSSPHVPVMMVATVQKEMAERLIAQPGTKDYGALSIWIQSQCRVEIVRLMAPSVFWPRPKVESAIVRIDLEPERRSLVPDLEFFHSFVRGLFLHRRKLLRGVLHAGYKNQLTKPQIDNLIEKQGLQADARAEQLGIEAMLALCEAVRAEL